MREFREFREVQEIKEIHFSDSKIVMEFFEASSLQELNIMTNAFISSVLKKDAYADFQMGTLSSNGNGGYLFSIKVGYTRIPSASKNKSAFDFSKYEKKESSGFDPSDFLTREEQELLKIEKALSPSPSLEDVEWEK